MRSFLNTQIIELYSTLYAQIKFSITNFGVEPNFKRENKRFSSEFSIWCVENNIKFDIPNNFNKVF